MFWTPQHVAHSPSLLSSESQALNFRGLYHLGALVLVRTLRFFCYSALSIIAQVVTNIRLILENILKYGLLVEFKVIETLQAEFESLDLRDWPVTLCFAGRFCVATRFDC